MTSTSSHPLTAPPRPAAQFSPQPSLRVWGLSPRELHDRRWSSMGVQVVRPGGAEPDPRGPKLYLLLDRDDAAVFALQPVVKRLNWLKPRAMLLRIIEGQSLTYVERVLADDEDRFIAIRREYRGRTRATMRSALTGDTKLATLWRESSGGRAGWAAIRSSAGRERRGVSVCRGSVFSLADEEGVKRCLKSLLWIWSSPGAQLDDVYEYMDGVLAHSGAHIEDGAKVSAPVWIGAGARVRAGDVIVGPEIVADAPGMAVVQREVTWDTVHYPGWRPKAELRGTWFRVSKRGFDILFSLAVLLATLPMYPVVILAIAIEDGWPPFFAHRRQTRRGREFPCYKFRTMCKDADRIKARLAAANQADGPQFFIRDDPRLLRVGKILRRFQIDEMPQFWNVLLGHMSVVGPRPSPDSENQFSPAWREARLSVRPGVTGLWQVRRTREPETDFQEWIRYDLEYVQHESWRLDMWIILKTIQKVLKG